MQNKGTGIRPVLVCLLLSGITASQGFAQVPQKMSFQSVIRDASGTIINEAQVGIRISILKGPLPGTVVYQESKTPVTAENGMVTLEIGSDPGFEAIEWGSGEYYIKTETDPEGGINYSISTTTPIISVPYTLISRTAQKVIGRFCYADRDGDGYGNAYAPVWIPGGVDLPAGYALNSGDSDDLNPSIH